MEELKMRDQQVLEILEEMGLEMKSLQPAVQGEAGETLSARLAPAEQEKQGKRPAQLEPLEDTRAAKKLTRMPMTKDQIDGLRVFAGKKELSIITNGSYKMGCRMIQDESRRKLAAEIFLSTIKSIKQGAADFIKEYDAKGYVEDESASHGLSCRLEPFLK